MNLSAVGWLRATQRETPARASLLSVLLRYGLGLVLLQAIAWPTDSMAIPPNTPITNQVVANYEVDGTAIEVTAEDTQISSPSSGNSAPSGVSLLTTEVDENAAAVVLGPLIAIDSDPADTHTIVLDAGADPRFEIVAGQLQLAPGSSLNFEIENNVTLPLVVTDRRR